MRGMYWEEWEVGAEFVSPARTVTVPVVPVPWPWPWLPPFSLPWP